MKAFIYIAIATILAITIGGHVPASAVTINFTETGEAVDGNVADFNGTVIKTRPAAETVQLEFTVLNGELGTVNRAMAFLLEPAAQANNRISDIVRLTVAGAGGTNRMITADFRSDSEDNLGALPANIFGIGMFEREMQGPVTLSGDTNSTKFFTLSGNNVIKYTFPSNFVITAQSEQVGPRGTAPEPSGLFLLGIGLCMIGLLRARRRQA